MDKNNAILERLKGNVTEKCRACGEYYTVIDSNMKICTECFTADNNVCRKCDRIVGDLDVFKSINERREHIFCSRFFRYPIKVLFIIIIVLYSPHSIIISSIEITHRKLCVGRRLITRILRDFSRISYLEDQHYSPDTEVKCCHGPAYISPLLLPGLYKHCHTNPIIIVFINFLI